MRNVSIFKRKSIKMINQTMNKKMNKQFNNIDGRYMGLNAVCGKKLLHYGLAFTICVFGIIEPAHADWFKVADIKTNLIKPIYDLVNDNLGFIAFAVGGATTFLTRGQDMYQKGIAFGVGSLGTAGSVKLAQTVLSL